MSSQSDPDADLMSRVKHGDLAAFEMLVDKYQQPVIQFICRTLSDPSEAEDLAQQVFVQVHRHAGRYRPSARFTTWLFTIARNLCLNEIRRRKRHPAQSLDQLREGDKPVPETTFRVNHEGQPPSPTQALLQAELETKIQEAVAALPEKQRSALALHREQHLSYEEIGQVLNCSLSATKSLIHRARETLKQRLKPYLKTGAWDPPEHE